MTLPSIYLAAVQVQEDIVQYVPHEANLGEVLMRMLPMFVIVYLIFHVMVLKPQEKKIKKHRELIENLKKGDTVMTESGMIGRVAGIEKEYILLEVANNTRVKFEPSKLSKLWEPKEKSDQAA